MVQLKAKGLEELSVRYAQPAIASLMKLGGSMLQALQSRLYWGGGMGRKLGCYLAFSKHGNGPNLV